MQMKRVAGYLVLSVLLCAARWADLSLWTDTATGLVTAGSVWWRYAALGIAVLLALLAGYTAPGLAAPLLRRQPAAAVPALAGALCCAAQGLLCLVSADADLVGGLLALPAAAWLAVLGIGWLRPGGRARPAPAVLGVAGSVLYCWGTLRSFMLNSSSWHRTVETAGIWQQLAALLLLAALARALCLPPESADPRAVCAGGLLAFCLCLCWQLPQCAVLYAAGRYTPAQLAAGLALCAVGLLGGVCTLVCARAAGQAQRADTLG